MQPNENEFNLAAVMHAWQKRWKLITAFVAISLVITSIVLVFLPQQYESTAVATAGNPLLSDKAYLFNQNVDQLYSNYGNADDIDRLLGIASLDTTYKLLVDSFKLYNYYTTSKNNKAIRRRNAVLGLKKDVQIQKNELNQFTISVWNKNPAVAAGIANSMLGIIQKITANGLQKSYEQTLFLLDSTLVGMQSEYQTITVFARERQTPKTAVELMDAKKETLLEQMNQYQKTYSEVAMAAANMQPSVIVLQSATPAVKAGKPPVLAWLLGVLLTSTAFALLAVLLYDRKPFLK
ncbi:MAG: hypothetical protein LH478_15670 [Chitinophagaceae bacterium]|nr:hypothetical protein [Chitinophagaceae bacterium]